MVGTYVGVICWRPYSQRRKETVFTNRHVLGSVTQRKVETHGLITRWETALEEYLIMKYKGSNVFPDCPMA
jgi:hypothetical protein